MDTDAIPESILAAASGADHYVGHLAEVNKNNEVVSTEDIYTKTGVLLLRKGAHINSDAAQKIVQHKLLKPLEDQVQLSKLAGKNELLKSFADLTERCGDIKALHTAADFQERFARHCASAQELPVITQRLTVLAERFPKHFDNAVFCAWLAALIARRMKLGSDIEGAAFIAGLSHDFGMLHIDPEIINKSGALTAAEWRSMQCHVVVGQLFLKNMKGLHPRVAVAVLEHHERCDGTGYPAGKSEEQLDVIGQVVGMADSLHAIRMNQFHKAGRNIRDAVPYLHINATTYTRGVYEAVHGLIADAAVVPSGVNPLVSFSGLVEHLIARGKQMQFAVSAFDAMHRLALFSGNMPETRKVLKVVDPVLRMIQSSGLLRDEILHHLHSLQSNPDESALAELIEIDLMQTELLWQIKKVDRTLRSLVSNTTVNMSTPDRDQLTTIMGNFATATENKADG